MTKANYLASPPLVVAYALAGTTDIDLTNEPHRSDAATARTFISKTFGRSQEEIRRRHSRHDYR